MDDNNKLMEKFIINMSASDVRLEMIALTVNMSQNQVKKVIEQNKEEINRRRQEKNMEELDSKTYLEDSESAQENKEKPEWMKRFKDKRNLPKKPQPTPMIRKLLSLREKVMMGEPFDAELLKELQRQVKVKSCTKRNTKEVELLIQIYSYIRRFENAKAIIRSIYDEESDKRLREIMIKKIEDEELKYNIMKYHRKGMSPSAIAKEVKALTSDVIVQLREQKDLDKDIKDMKEYGLSEQQIVKLTEQTLERVKFGLESKEINGEAR